MNKVSHAIVKLRIPIFILALVLVFPAAISYSRTKVNYDMLSYLPQDIDTMKGQNIMVDEFGSGAFSEIIVEGMTDKQVSSLKSKVEKVDHVKTVLWYDSLFGSSIPMNMLPDDIYDKFNNGDATMLFVIYDDTSAADTTTMACREIRALCDVNCFVAGITPVLIDTQKLADQEAPVYVMLAVIFATIILMISMDSFLVPFLFLASIGMAIIYNLGTNFILGSISYVTKALAGTGHQRNVLIRRRKLGHDHCRFHRTVLHELHTRHGPRPLYVKGRSFRRYLLCHGSAFYGPDFRPDPSEDKAQGIDSGIQRTRQVGPKALPGFPHHLLHARDPRHLRQQSCAGLLQP